MAEKREKRYKAPNKPYSQARANFICEHIGEGMHLSEVLKKYPDQCPSEHTVYNWKKQHPEFKLALDMAYQDLFFKKVDVLEACSKELLEIVDEDKSMGKENYYNFRARSDALRQRIDVLKFQLAKLAPKICDDLKDNNQLQIAIPQITVINYADREENKECTQKENAKNLLTVLPQK